MNIQITALKIFSTLFFLIFFMDSKAIEEAGRKDVKDGDIVFILFSAVVVIWGIWM